MSLYREQLNDWISKIDVKAGYVIDVGGADNPIKNNVRSWDVEVYDIMDNDKSLKPDIIMDFNDLLEREDYGEPKKTGPYDVVFCLELMEYIYNPVQAHENIRYLLGEGGIAYISYPTIYPLHNPPDIDYLRYSKNAIRKLLKEAGFKECDITPRVATAGRDHLAQFYASEGMRAMKHTEDIYNIGYLVKAWV